MFRKGTYTDAGKLQVSVRLYLAPVSFYTCKYPNIFNLTIVHTIYFPDTNCYNYCEI